MILGLEEDGASYDWTAMGLKARVTAKLIAKAQGIWAAEPLVFATNQCAKEIGVDLKVESSLKDGATVKKGDVLVNWQGEARAILAFERPFINLASYVSGIATQTRSLVDVIAKSQASKKPRLTATRKTLPGYRDLAIHGVLAGSGYSHRLGLSSGVLIKENHIEAAGGVAQSIQKAKEQAPHGLKIEIEVKNMKELEEASRAGAEIVMLDNFTPSQVQEAVKWKQKNAPSLVIEVSGGITVENIGAYSIDGVDIISSGSLTHSVKALDLSLLIDT